MMQKVLSTKLLLLFYIFLCATSAVYISARSSSSAYSKVAEFYIGKQLQLHTPQGTVLLQKILHLMQQGGIVITESDPGHSKEILSEQKSLLLNDTTSAPFRHVFFANLQAFYIPGSCTASPFGRVFNSGAAPLCRTSKNRVEACILPAERVQ